MTIHQLIEFLKSQLHSNQFLAGGAVLGILAGFLSQAREWPSQIWEWFLRRIFIVVVINDRDEAFLWVCRWLAQHPYGNRWARSLSVLTEHPDPSSDALDRRPRMLLTPARGQHWFFYRRRLVLLNRAREDITASAGGGRPAPSRGAQSETFTLKILARRRKIAIDLLEDAREVAHPSGEVRTPIMTYQYGWGVTVDRRPRPAESVILRAGLLEDMIAEIGKFLRREAWYVARGIPYRLGIELHGAPGSGKSSAIAAIAAHFNMGVAILNLLDVANDTELRSVLSEVPRHSMILIEDIDCVFVQRENQDDSSRVTFSGLLNAIDGVAAGEGRILWMTTNRHHLLDGALIRPGRVDLQYEVGVPDANQVTRIFTRFFPEAQPSQTARFLAAVGDVTLTSMSALQGLLLKYSDDAEAAIQHAADVRPAVAVGEVAHG